MLIAKRCLVAGRVQGVFYRASTQQQARFLGINGHAKNLPDGRVEVIAVGETDQVNALMKWLWRGSPSSHVTHIEVSDVDVEATRGMREFETA